MKPSIPKIVGKTESKAEALLEKAGFIMRVARRDKESFVLTCDYRTDRVNVGIEKGKVVSADVG